MNHSLSTPLFPVQTEGGTGELATDSLPTDSFLEEALK